MKRFVTLLSALLVALLAGPWGALVPAAHASDSSAPPVKDGWVQVATAQQLGYINEHQQHYLNAKIRLLNDIDLSGYDWIPLGGNAYSPFSGIFDGRGHRISGIAIRAEGSEEAGFFGKVSGVVQNLGVVVNIVEGGASTGGLVGSLDGGSIHRSYSSGSVKGGNGAISSVTGGLVGSVVNSTISSSYSTASVVSGVAPNNFVGGLIGSQGAGAITNAYAAGSVTNAGQEAGISYLWMGGLAGTVVYGSISASYASGPTASSHPVQYEIIAGLVGGLQLNASATQSYFDTETSGQSLGVADRFGGGPSDVTALSSSQMRQLGSFTGWDIEAIWANHPAVNNGYPYLRPVILTDSLPQASVGLPYAVAAAGFDGAAGGLSWQASGLPEGLRLSGDGELQGTPEQAGVFNITLTATDAGSTRVSSNVQLVVVEEAPDIQGFAIGPGRAFGSTKVTAELTNPEHAFAYDMSVVAFPRPLRGDRLPAETTAYTAGTDIEGVNPELYLALYEVDKDRRIQAWSIVRLEASHIQDAKSVTGVRILEGNLTLVEQGEARTLTAVVEPDDAANPAVTWRSSAPDIAAVDAAGRVTPGAPGTAEITVTTVDGGFTASVTVTVEPIPPNPSTPVTGVRILEGNLTLVEQGEVRTLTAVVEPDDAANPAVTWRSSAPDIAAVNAAGRVTPVAPGTAEITVTTVDGGFTASVTVTVTAKTAPPTLGTVTGTVYGVGNSPLGGARVSISDIEATTDNQGTFTLKDVPAGRHPLMVTAARYAKKEVIVDIKAGESVDAGQIHLTRAAAGRSGPGPSPRMTVQINDQAASLGLYKETSADGRTTARLVWDTGSLSSLFADNREAVLVANTTDPIVKLELPAGAVHEALRTEPEAVLRLEISGASYSVPLKVWASSASDAVLTIAIARATDAYSSELKAELSEQNIELLAAPVEFSLYDNGRAMADFGRLYMTHTMTFDAEVDSGRSTVVWVDEDSRIHFVPSVFRTESNLATAAFYAPHNSMYAVIRSDLGFADTNGHWAHNDIITLANKRILQGIASDAFAPDAEVTRAEFMAMLVRAMGLAEKPGDVPFTDVKRTDWYAETAAAAYESGLIHGNEDGTLRPNELITREQMAVMMARAMSMAAPQMPHADAAALESYTDASEVSAWAREAVGQALAAKAMNGLTDASFAPQAYATRAQSAAVLKRMLQFLQFIDG